MRNIIKVPQKGILRHCPNLNLIDCAILDFALQYQFEAFTKSDRTGIWFLMSYKTIIDSLPIVRLNTRQSVAEHVQRLIDYEILDKHPLGKHNKKTFYKFREHPVLMYY